MVHCGIFDALWDLWVYCVWSFSFNSLRPSDAIWRQWSWTTLAQVMACCLTAPSHYLNQCWLFIRGVLWHTSESSFAGIAQGIDSGYEFEKDILKNIFKSPRGQWVNSLWLSGAIWHHWSGPLLLRVMAWGLVSKRQSGTHQSEISTNMWGVWGRKHKYK